MSRPKKIYGEATLTEAEKKVLLRYYRICETDPWVSETMKRIAEQLKCSPQWVRILKERATAKLFIAYLEHLGEL